MRNWQYQGDVNVGQGGSWIDLDRETWEWGYLECVKVSDLDGVCGTRGMVMIEHITILLDKDYWIGALACCGMTIGNLLGMESNARRHALADVLLCYGRYDPDDSWDGYGSYHTEILQTENESMTHDGWTATKRINCEDLQGYIESVHLN